MTPDANALDVKPVQNVLRLSIAGHPGSLHDLAKKCGVSVATLSRFGRGFDASGDVIDRLARFFRLSLTTKRSKR